jgi:purine-cytosine permease-like protein
LVILAMSIVANNCPNIYSVSLSMQILARATARVPRFVWTFLGTCCYIAIAIPGYSHFETILENFMLIIVCHLSYSVPFVLILCPAGLLARNIRSRLSHRTLRFQKRL